MGISIRDLLFHLQFQAIQSERPGTGQKERMERTVSVRKFRLGILIYLSRNPVFPGNFPFRKTKLVFHLHSNRNFRIFFVNGKQPLSYHRSRYSPKLTHHLFISVTGLSSDCFGIPNPMRYRYLFQNALCFRPHISLRGTYFFNL